MKPSRDDMFWVLPSWVWRGRPSAPQPGGTSITAPVKVAVLRI